MQVFYIIRSPQLIGRWLYVMDSVEVWFTEYPAEAKRFLTRTDAVDHLEKWIKGKKTEFYLFEIEKFFDVHTLIANQV